MSYTLPRPAPYSTAQPTGVQSPAMSPPSQGNPSDMGTRQPPSQQNPYPNPSPSPLPQQQPSGGQSPSPTPPTQPASGPDASAPPPPWMQSQQPGPNPLPAPRFGGGQPHPVDLFHQMVQHPHGQAILQSQGWTPPQPRASYGTQPPATPTVPNPGLSPQGVPTPR